MGTVGGVQGPGGVHGNYGSAPPNQTERDKFKAGLADKSNDELVSMMSDKNLKPWQLEEVGKTLAARMSGNEENGGPKGAGGPSGAGGVGDAGGGDVDEDLLKKLFDKLMKGQIKPEELKELQGLLEKAGIPPEAIAKLFEAHNQKLPEGADNTI